MVIHGSTVGPWVTATEIDDHQRIQHARRHLIVHSRGSKTSSVSARIFSLSISGRWRQRAVSCSALSGLRGNGTTAATRLTVFGHGEALPAGDASQNLPAMVAEVPNANGAHGHERISGESCFGRQPFGLDRLDGNRVSWGHLTASATVATRVACNNTGSDDALTNRGPRPDRLGPAARHHSGRPGAQLEGDPKEAQDREQRIETGSTVGWSRRTYIHLQQRGCPLATHENEQTLKKRGSDYAH